MAIDFNKIKISDTEKESLKISNLADRPNAPNSYGKAKMSAQDIKQAFDNQFDLLVNQHNQLVDGQGSLCEMYGDLHGALEAIRDIQNNLSETMVVELKKDEENGADEENDEKVDASVFALLDKIYPVDSIYMSTSSTSPETLFGGKWAQLKDGFLVSAGYSYTDTNGTTVTITAGDKRGSTSHTHGLSKGYAMYVPHTNNINAEGETKVGGEYWRSISCDWKSSAANYSKDDSYALDKKYTSDGKPSGDNPGSGTALGGSTDSGSNLPPYLAVYMWKRTG